MSRRHHHSISAGHLVASVSCQPSFLRVSDPALLLSRSDVHGPHVSVTNSVLTQKEIHSPCCNFVRTYQVQFFRVSQNLNLVYPHSSRTDWLSVSKLVECHKLFLRVRPTQVVHCDLQQHVKIVKNRSKSSARVNHVTCSVWCATMCSTTPIAARTA